MISMGAPSLTGYFRGRAGTARRAVFGVPVVVGAAAVSGGTAVSGGMAVSGGTAVSGGMADFDVSAVFGDVAVFGDIAFGDTLLGAVMVNAPYKCVVTCVSCVPARPEQLIGEPGDSA
jgi:NAD-dependent dihydropyrimidine dehydrogenase PreA subunit